MIKKKLFLGASQSPQRLSALQQNDQAGESIYNKSIGLTPSLTKMLRYFQKV